MVNNIKHGFKIALFLIGLLLFGGFGAVIFSEQEVLTSTRLRDITMGQFVVILFFLVGVYIITTLLKSRTMTRWEFIDRKEIQKKNRNNGN